MDLLPTPCSHCRGTRATVILQYGGPWLRVCDDCMTLRMKFGIYHYQYLFQVLVRAGLSRDHANIAIAAEITRDGLPCFVASEECLAAFGEETRERILGPLPELVVEGCLRIQILKG